MDTVNQKNISIQIFNLTRPNQPEFSKISTRSDPTRGQLCLVAPVICLSVRWVRGGYAVFPDDFGRTCFLFTLLSCYTIRDETKVFNASERWPVTDDQNVDCSINS